MYDKKQMDILYSIADQFIEVANKLSQKDSSGGVGAGMRYGTARYSIFEVSLSGRDLAKDKEDIKKELLKDYTAMLDDNLNSYIHHLAMESAKK
jgi:hypothetical protein